LFGSLRYVNVHTKAGDVLLPGSYPTRLTRSEFASGSVPLSFYRMERRWPLIGALSYFCLFSALQGLQIAVPTLSKLSKLSRSEFVSGSVPLSYGRPGRRCPFEDAPSSSCFFRAFPAFQIACTRNGMFQVSFPVRNGFWLPPATV